MNFILKNIWWVALFIFFAIMLLIISANQKDNIVTNKALETAKQELVFTGSTTSTGELANLVKLLDEWDKAVIEAEEVEVKLPEVDTKELSLDTTKKMNPIKKFFMRKDKEVISDEVMVSTGATMEEKEESKPKADMTIVKKVVSTPIPATIVHTEWLAVKKSAPAKMFKDSPAYTFGSKAIVYPGLNLKTAVGNTYKVWVHSLKINNAYFNKNLAYTMKGDILKQLTPENNHGCFKVEVLSSKLQASKWVVWYACKKWLEANTTVESVAAKQVVHNVVTTSIGDVHSVAPAELKINNASFDTVITKVKAGDTVEQVSAENQYGCFKVRIMTSSLSTNDIGKVGYACKKYLIAAQ